MAAKELVRIVPGDEPAAPPGLPTGMARSGYERARMVEWLRPRELLRTGCSVIASAIFESRTDRRTLEALRSDRHEYYDYSEIRDGELWVDFVADTGDGFDSTYAVAHAVASETLAVKDSAGTLHHTQRGRILVFGGDLVYPVASRARYEQRLVMPYELALPHSEAPHPDLYAIPGNHDWYDSLVAFTRRFCSQRWFAGWRTHQQVSYFALQLPGDWWLVGTDVHLDSDIDADQVAYFKAIAETKMTDRSRVILCNAEPHWLYARSSNGVEFLDNNLRFLEDQVFGRKIAVFLSGDLHYYRRHSDGDDHHKIIAGGGGAFLHPTHGRDVRSLPGQTPGKPYVLEKSYPAPETTRGLARRSFRFPISNWRFSLTLGLLYLLACRALPVDVSGLGWGWGAVMVGAMVLLAEGSSRRRWISGALHAAVHLAIAQLTGWGAVQALAPLELGAMTSAVSAGGLVVLAGWAIGGLVVGTYLFVQLNWLGSHDNIAFAPLAIPDWKNFVRLHIDRRGTLTIYPIGIDRVPRRWQSQDGAPRLVPVDGTPPRLIEDAPIEVKR